MPSISISKLFSLSLALLTTTTFAASIRNAKVSPPILCYDSRYAIQHPIPDDCAAIINQQIGGLPNLAVIRSFSRNPGRHQFLLPHTWATERHECNVTIDIMQLPGEIVSHIALASMYDIRRAAFEVFMACVLRDDRLGGITQTGKWKNLQVRVESGGQSRYVS